MKVIDKSALLGAPLQESPFPYAVIGRSFCPSLDPGVLADEFLTDGFKYDVRLANPEGKKQYRAYNYQLLDRGNLCHDHIARLTPNWRDVLDDVCSAEYRAAIATLTGIDLDDTVLDVRLVRYGHNDWIEPHVDRPDKTVTHLYYLSKEWKQEWSGALRILRSSDIDDCAREVLPLAGVSVIMMRTDLSWHAVPAVRSTSGQYRNVFLVHFVTR